MKADDLANLVHARSAGRNRWQARCPSHDDRSPSLVITQGDRGILVRCWSQGCTPAQIMAALGLSLKDLFDDTSATPAQRQQVEQERQARDAVQRKVKAADRKLITQLWQLREWIQQAGASTQPTPRWARNCMMPWSATPRWKRSFIPRQRMAHTVNQHCQKPHRGLTAN